MTPHPLAVDWLAAWTAAPVVVLVVVLLLDVRRWRRHAPDAPAIGPAELPDDVRRTINAHLAGGRPIGAIKTYRQATGVGLVEAKRAIDGWPGA